MLFRRIYAILTVHDELCFNVNSDEQAARISEIMSTCVKELKVPFDVDTELGDNWGRLDDTEVFCLWMELDLGRRPRR